MLLSFDLVLVETAMDALSWRSRTSRSDVARVTSGEQIILSWRNWAAMTE